MGVLSLAGALMMTFLAPPVRCFPASYSVRKSPVDSQTYSAPASPHLRFEGSFSLKTVIF